MNWIGIAVGGAAGLVAVLISVGVLKLLGKSSETTGARVLHLIVFAAALTLGREFVQPILEAHAVDARLLKMPLYKALKEHEPEVYDRVLKLIEEGIATKQPQEQVLSSARPLITEVATRRILHSSDQVQLRFAEHAVAATSALYKAGGTTCFSYIQPASGEAINYMSLLPPELIQQELQLLTDIVVSSAGQTRQLVSEDVAATGIDQLFAKLEEKYSAEEIAVLADPTAAGIDKRRYCEISIDLYRAALSLPPPNNSLVIRLLLQG